MAQDLGEELEANIPLYEAIQSLRQELQAAVNEAKDKTLKFGVEKVEVELEVSIQRTLDTDGKVDLKLFAIGASKKVERGVTAKFKLLLSPRSAAHGAQIEVSGRIEGARPPGS